MTVTQNADTMRLTMTDIAAFAGVRRPVVSNWRRRHRDFPKPLPTGTADKPLFAASEVVDWLVATKRVDAMTARADLAVHCLTEFTGHLGERDLVGELTALIALSADSGDMLASSGTSWPIRHAALREQAAVTDPDDLMLRSEIDMLSGTSESLLPLVDELIEAAWGHHHAIERVLAARHRLGFVDSRADAVAEPVAQLMAGLTGAADRAASSGSVTVVDLDAGIGDLICAVLATIPDGTETTVRAAERTTSLARILRRRLAVRSDLADWAVDTAYAPDQSAASLIGQAPYRPAEQRDLAAELSALTDLAASLVPGQVAVYLTPADALIDSLRRNPRADRIRRELLATGAVEAVITLLGGTLPFRPAYETAVVVLAPTGHTDPTFTENVLLADVSSQRLTTDVVELLTAEITAWRRVDTGHRVRSQQLTYRTPLREASAIGATLRPRPRRDLTVAARVPETLARVLDLEVALDRHAAAPRPKPIHSHVALRDGAARVLKSIADLTAEGVVKVLSGTRLQAEHWGFADKVGHAVIGAEEVIGETRPGARRIALATLAAHYLDAELTLPGDVIVTTTPRLGILLDEEGSSVVVFPARVLRLIDRRDKRFTPRGLARLLATGATAERAGSVHTARRLDEFELPLLHPAEAAELDSLLAVLDRREAELRDVQAAIAELRAIVTGGLADGTLTFSNLTTSKKGS